MYTLYPPPTTTTHAHTHTLPTHTHTAGGVVRSKQEDVSAPFPGTADPQ